jgi:hypothetical protein
MKKYKHSLAEKNKLEPTVDFDFESVFKHLDGPSTDEQKQNRLAEYQDFLNYIAEFCFGKRTTEKKTKQQERIITTRLLTLMYLLIGKHLPTKNIKGLILSVRCPNITHEQFCWHLRQTRRWIKTHSTKKQSGNK